MSNEFIMDNGVLIEYRGSDKKVSVPDGIKRIGKYAFSPYEDESRTLSSYKIRKLNKISEVIIPGSVESIDDSAFRDSKVTKIVLEDGLERIGDYAFATCNLLEDIDLPSTLKVIGNNAFSGVVWIWDEDGFVIDEDDTVFTIYGQKGSVAEEYAKDNNFNLLQSINVRFDR